MRWDKSFKKALVKEDVKTIDKLLGQMPEFDNIEDMRTAYTLIDQVKRRFENKQLFIQKKMNEMQYQRAS